MKKLDTYIIEKLRINKDTKSNYKSYIDGILFILGIEDIVNDKSKVKNKILDWLGDYSKTLYCYCSKKDYDNRLAKVKEELDAKISFSPIENSLMAKAINLTDKKVYDGRKEGDDIVEKILISDYDIAIYLFDKLYPIIFEKSKI